ncbi:hypothetical protein DAEQUDRAFT_448429 [Daedalea quercina L-15889]|uniref:Uncharacterized protein n=1 Tax=Daedalea quercina L-15889 TaxID=1314783 RepID=A0A165N613_9APHY|nr:hypothetical protein DAEQUDRAFT_448429 [Daedalea quercina L-15889]
MSPETTQSLNLQGGLEAFYVHKQYVLTFDTKSVDVWRAGGGRLNHVTRLAQFVECPPHGLDPIIDTDRNIIIVADIDRAGQNGSPLLLVFNLADGQLVRRCELYGTNAEKPLQYVDGKVLVTIEENEDRAPPHGLTTILLWDVADDNARGFLGGVNLPVRLRAREERRTNTDGGVLFPIQLRPNGDVIATSSAAWYKKMEVLRWRGVDVPRFPEPDASIELEVPHEDYDEIHPTSSSCCVPLDESSFLMPVYEAAGSFLPVGGACQTTIYAVDAETMTIRWRAEPVGGHVHSVHYVAALDSIVAFGNHDNGDGIKRDPLAYVLVLDPATGTQRRMESLIYRIQGRSVQYCGLSRQTDGFAIVVVFRDGTTCAVHLEQFLEQGFPTEGERLACFKPFGEETFQVEEVSIAEQMAVLSVDDGSGSLHLRYFSLE